MDLHRVKKKQKHTLHLFLPCDKLLKVCLRIHRKKLYDSLKCKYCPERRRRCLHSLNAFYASNTISHKLNASTNFK